MTLEEKREFCGNFCNEQQKCETCSLNNDANVWCGNYNEYNAPENVLDYSIKKIQALGQSNVDHPSHYNREGSMECIDEMVMVFGEEVVANFCLCNVWKYRYRAADKNGIEDLKKSDWYMNKYKELITSE